MRNLDVRQGDGNVRTSLDSSLLLDALSFVVDLHQDASVLALLEARRVLEAEAAALAARRIDPRRSPSLRVTLEAMPGAPASRSSSRTDSPSTALIAAASGNPCWRSCSRACRPDGRARNWRGVTEAGATDRTVSSTGDRDAIEQGKPELAHAWMNVHLASVGLAGAGGEAQPARPARRRAGGPGEDGLPLGRAESASTRAARSSTSP